MSNKTNLDKFFGIEYFTKLRKHEALAREQFAYQAITQHGSALETFL